MLYLKLPAFMFGAMNVGYLLVHMLHCPAGLESRRRHVAPRMNTFNASQHSFNAYYRDEEHQFRQTMEKMTEKVGKKDREREPTDRQRKRNIHDISTNLKEGQRPSQQKEKLQNMSTSLYVHTQTTESLFPSFYVLLLRCIQSIRWFLV